jgi:tol-pal system protein YbgF
MTKLGIAKHRAKVAYRLRDDIADATDQISAPVRIPMRMAGFARIAMIALMLAANAPALAAPGQTQDAARRLYDRVMEEYRQRDYHAALAGFRFFLELHGKSGLAPSARYWLGECQYRLGRYDDAMDTFLNLVSYFPSSPKIPATTLKIGMTYTKLGQPDEARITFQRVVADWPDSIEAEVARKELAKYGPTGERDLEQ